MKALLAMLLAAVLTSGITIAWERKLRADSLRRSPRSRLDHLPADPRRRDRPLRARRAADREDGSMIASESAPGLRGGEIPVVIFAVLFGIFMVGMILWDARRPDLPRLREASSRPE